MKRIIFVITLILSVTMLFGCHATVVNIDEDAVATDTKEDIPVTQEQTTEEQQNEDIEPVVVSGITVEDEIFSDMTEFDSGATAEIFVTAPKIKADEYGENVDLFNQLIDINIDTVKNEYLYDVAVGEGAEGANSSSRTLSYEIYCAEDGRISLLLRIISQSGSTNPATGYKAINFDLNEGRVLNLADITNGDKIDLVRAEIIEQMRSDGDKYYSTEETALDNIDFSNSFLFNGEKLYIYFEEYVIAPRSAGMQMFEIDLNKIA